jgi:ADP-ribose pyrophosphatase YjhB (NUDIX family)
MAYVGFGRYVVVVLHVGGTKLSDIKLVLQREPRSSKTWFPAGSVTANEEPIDVAIRALHEETCLILTHDDLTLLSDAPVRVALPVGQQLVCVDTASVPVPYVIAHLRTPAELEQGVTALSTINPDGSHVVPETIDVLILNLTPAKMGLLPTMKHNKSELFHFGYVTQWETFLCIENDFFLQHVSYSLVYTKYRMRRLLSLGPPNYYAIQGTCKSGLDR